MENPSLKFINFDLPIDFQSINDNVSMQINKRIEESSQKIL